MAYRKNFILDVEATGPEEKDYILVIAILELDFVNDYWIPGRAYHRLFSYAYGEREMTAFAKEYQRELYEECMQIDGWDSCTHVRKTILDFFETCGCVERDEIKLMGWDVGSCDLPQLRHNKYLLHKYVDRDENGKETIKGDYNFIIYEIAGAFRLAQDILGLSEKELKTKAIAAYDFPMPGRKKTPNRAMYDCYQEAKLLNGLIKLIREFRSED